MGTAFLTRRAFGGFGFLGRATLNPTLARSETWGVSECLVFWAREKVSEKTISDEVLENESKDITSVLAGDSRKVVQDRIKDYQSALWNYYRSPHSTREKDLLRVQAVEKFISYYLGSEKTAQLVRVLKKTATIKAFDSRISAYEMESTQVRAEELTSAFADFCDALGVSVKKTQIEVTGTDGKTKLEPAIQILSPADPSQAKTQMEMLAAVLGRSFQGDELMFAPAYLKRAGAEAMYEEGSKANPKGKFFISVQEAKELGIEESSGHELDHAYDDYLASLGVDSYFRGSLSAKFPETISSIATGYDRYQHLSEMSAYAVSLSLLGDEVRGRSLSEFQKGPSHWVLKDLLSFAGYGKGVASQTHEVMGIASDVVQKWAADPSIGDQVRVQLDPTLSSRRLGAQVEIVFVAGKSFKFEVFDPPMVEAIRKFQAEATPANLAELARLLGIRLRYVQKLSGLMSQHFAEVQAVGASLLQPEATEATVKQFWKSLFRPRRISLLAQDLKPGSFTQSETGLGKFAKEWLKKKREAGSTKSPVDK